MILNIVILEAIDQISNLNRIVRDPTGRSMHWLASKAYPILCWSPLPLRCKSIPAALIYSFIDEMYFRCVLQIVFLL